MKIILHKTRLQINALKSADYANQFLTHNMLSRDNHFYSNSAMKYFADIKIQKF